MIRLLRQLMLGNIYIYIVIHRQAISQLFCVARHVRFSKLTSKPGWFKHQSKILPHSHEETSVSEGILNSYISHLFCLHISTLLLPRDQFIRKALPYASGNHYFLRSWAQPHGGRWACICMCVYISNFPLKLFYQLVGPWQNWTGNNGD